MREVMKAVFALSVCSAVALGAPIDEVEPNDTLATAQFIGEEFYPFGAVAISGSLVPNDVDVFAFDVDAGDFVVVNVFSLDPLGDPVLAVYNQNDDFVELVDDSFGLNPVWSGEIPVSGIWKFVVGGNAGDAGEDDIFGTHDETFDYLLTFKIPEPATAALVGMGLLGLARRRRLVGRR